MITRDATSGWLCQRDNHRYQSKSVFRSETRSETKHGLEAATEMMNRKGMVERADKFFTEQPSDEKSYEQFFLEKIQEKQSSLPDSPSYVDYEVFTHRIFNFYRQAVVKKACAEVEACLVDWTFTDSTDWENVRASFQDFIFYYSKTQWSGAQDRAILNVMKKHFSSLPSNFSPQLYKCVLGPEEDNFYKP